MGEKTGISWTDATVNFWQGCHKVSAGCMNCYMFAEKRRYGQTANVVIRSAPATFNAPLKWAKNREKYGHINRVFVCSWSDFFIEEADAWRDEAWEIMRRTPHLTYQICTKRPERIKECLPPEWGIGFSNVWIGVTAENQETADERIPILLKTPAAVRFISAEPLLGPIDLHQCGAIVSESFPEASSCDGSDGWYEIAKIDWLICGGESGPNARPMLCEWADSLQWNCRSARVPFFFKQGSQNNWQTFKDFNSFPDNLKVREFPKG